MVRKSNCRARAWIATCLAASFLPASLAPVSSLIADEPEAKVVEQFELVLEEVASEVEAAEAEEAAIVVLPAEASETITLDVETDAPEYWLGLNLDEVPPLVRKHLKIKGGAIAIDVIPQSPAGKAGIQQEDIILEVAGTVINQAGDVLLQLKEVKGKPLQIRLIREGLPMSVEVTPTKRPAEIPAVKVPEDEAVDNEEIQAYSKQLRELEEQAMQTMQQRDEVLQKISRAMAKRHQNLTLWALRPAIAARTATRPTLSSTSRLPGGLMIKIDQSAEGPAKIEVKQGDKTWNCTSDSYEGLPEELADQVKRHVSGMMKGAFSGQAGMGQATIAQGAVQLPHGVIVQPFSAYPGMPAMPPGVPHYQGAVPSAPAIAVVPSMVPHPHAAVPSYSTPVQPPQQEVLAALRELTDSVKSAQQRLEKQVAELNKQVQELREKTETIAPEAKPE